MLHNTANGALRLLRYYLHAKPAANITSHIIFSVLVKHLNIAKSFYNVHCLSYIDHTKYARISLQSNIMHGLSFEYIKYTLNFPAKRVLFLLFREKKEKKKKEGETETVFHLRSAYKSRSGNLNGVMSFICALVIRSVKPENEN